MVSNKLLTLAFVRESARVLLGFKKRGFGQGRWNGFGGKVNPGETVYDGAKRELLEESGIVAEKLDPIGVLMFEFVGDPQLMEVHVYQTTTFSGEPTESDEMRPQWYRHEDIPFKEMWPDDILWFPLMLKDKHFYGYFIFEGMDRIVDYSLREVEDVNKVDIPKAPLGSINHG